MGVETKIHIKNSIATRMLLVVLGLYLLIAMGVTLTHVWVEYKYQKAIIIQGLGDIENAFENELAVSLWDFDEESLKASVEGMLRIPTLVGIQIRSNSEAIVAIGGLVTHHGEAGNFGLHVSLFGSSDAETAVHRSESYNFEMFEHQFPITYDRRDKTIVLGQATIYSNSSVIYRRMKLQVAMLAVNVVLTLFTFSLALLWAFNRYLRRPLFSLSSATRKVRLENLDSFTVRIGISGQNELKVLEQSFNSMIANLRQSMVEREHAEEALRLFKFAVAASTDAIGMSTADGRHYYQNIAFDRMFGEIGEDPPSTLYIDQAVGKEVFQTIMAGKLWVGEVKMHGVDNKMLDIFLRAYPVKDRDGKVVNLVGVHTDITEWKQAERNLATEKERLAVTLRSIGDGVITTDTSRNVILLNKVAENLTGWGSEEAVGLPLEKVLPTINGQTREKYENSVTQITNSSSKIAGLVNTVLVAKDGRERSIAACESPILNIQGNVIGVVIVFRDITEQIKTERELLKVTKLESIGVLAGGIAHDFNNILAAILGNINLALFDTDLKDKTLHLLREAEKASLRAQDLTQQLLTFAKGGEPVKEVSSLESVIKDSADFILYGEKVACRYDFQEDLWMVDIDKGQISQVIQNIVLNASHAMPEGGIVTIACENLASVGRDVLPYAKDGKFVKISIQDNGIGIPENVVGKIFDPYFSTKHGGSGLGLSITQSIINKHSGHIVVESSPGLGSTFSLFVPAIEETKPQMQESLKKTEASSQGKILVMDDEEMVRSMVKEMLVRLGHEVVLSSNGEETLTSYQESMNSGNPFDLVIMDLTIPGGMGGKEAVQELLNIDPSAKVIVSSGYSNDPIMANFKEYGFCSAIGKPYKLQELSKVISQFL